MKVKIGSEKKNGCEAEKRKKNNSTKVLQNE